MIQHSWEAEATTDVSSVTALRHDACGLHFCQADVAGTRQTKGSLPSSIGASGTSAPSFFASVLALSRVRGRQPSTQSSSEDAHTRAPEPQAQGLERAPRIYFKIRNRS